MRGQFGVVFGGAGFDAIKARCSHHTNVQVSVTHPIDSVFHILNGSQD